MYHRILCSPPKLDHVICFQFLGLNSFVQRGVHFPYWQQMASHKLIKVRYISTKSSEDLLLQTSLLHERVYCRSSIPTTRVFVNSRSVVIQLAQLTLR